MVQMPVSPCFVDVNSYQFCSNGKPLQVTGGHARGHGITHHAAQKQQEDHDDEQGAAHE